MERNERLKAADKCASKYTNENEAHIARAAFMLGCEFEAQGEIVKGVVLEAETSYDTQQYTPSPSVDIGDVARVQFASHAKVFDKKRKAVFDWEQFKEVAGIFYGFGKKDFPETKEKEQPDKSLEEAIRLWVSGVFLAYTFPDTTVKTLREIVEKTFIAGAEWQKKQMMKETVEGEGEGGLGGGYRCRDCQGHSQPAPRQERTAPGIK